MKASNMLIFLTELTAKDEFCNILGKSLIMGVESSETLRQVKDPGNADILNEDEV